jgi:hypothetical protein
LNGENEQASKPGSFEAWAHHKGDGRLMDVVTGAFPSNHYRNHPVKKNQALERKVVGLCEGLVCGNASRKKVTQNVDRGAKMAERDTYKYDFKIGNKIVHTGTPAALA